MQGSPAGVVEWRGVDIATGKELFRSDIYPEGSISQGELCAILDGIKWLLDEGSDQLIYSDSEVGIHWAKNPGKPPKMNASGAGIQIAQRIWSDLGWLELDEVRHLLGRLKKWETKKWGENPADLGYKGYQRVSVWAVTRGRNTGVFDSWSEAAQQVVSFAGASFRRFPRSEREKAMAYLEAHKDDIIGGRASALFQSSQGVISCTKQECAYPACMCGL